mgnify:FL=1
MLLMYLQDTYRENDPIFIGEVAAQTGRSGAAVRQSLKRLVDRGKLLRFSEGIYYFPKQSWLFRSTPPDMEQIIIRKYIESGENTIGYYSGLTLSNIAGITTQMPAEQCIVTNAEKSRRRIVSIRKRRICLKAPRTAVNQKNKDALSVLDLVGEAFKYTEYDREETEKRLRAYIRRLGVAKASVRACLSYYPSKTSKLLLEMGIYDVLA